VTAATLHRSDFVQPNATNIKTNMGHLIMVDPQVISQIIGVPVLQISASPFNEILVVPSLDDLMEFFHAVPQGGEQATTIRIRAFSPPHHLLTKIVQQNLWPTVKESDLIQKRA
jgi:hypothetical protein